MAEDELDETGLDDQDEVKKFYIDDEPVWVVAEGVFRLDPNTRKPRLVQYRSFVADAVRELVPRRSSFANAGARALHART